MSCKDRGIVICASIGRDNRAIPRDKLDLTRCNHGQCYARFQVASQREYRLAYRRIAHEIWTPDQHSVIGTKLPIMCEFRRTRYNRSPERCCCERVAKEDHVGVRLPDSNEAFNSGKEC